MVHEHCSDLFLAFMCGYVCTPKFKIRFSSNYIYIKCKMEHVYACICMYIIDI